VLLEKLRWRSGQFQAWRKWLEMRNERNPRERSSFFIYL